MDPFILLDYPTTRKTNGTLRVFWECSSLETASEPQRLMLAPSPSLHIRANTLERSVPTPTTLRNSQEKMYRTRFPAATIFSLA